MTEEQLTTLVKIIGAFENEIKTTYPAYSDPPGDAVGRSIGFGILIINGNTNLITPNGWKIINDSVEQNLSSTGNKLTESEFRTLAHSNSLKISYDYALELLKLDVSERVKLASKKLSNWNILPYKAQVAVINIMYQYGSDSFPVTFKSIDNQNYEVAAKEFLIQKYLYNTAPNYDAREFYNARLLLESQDEVNGNTKIKEKYGF